MLDSQPIKENRIPIMRTAPYSCLCSVVFRLLQLHNDKVTSPVRTRAPHFSVFPEFVDASYARRYELFCRKLVLERHYSASALLMSGSETGPEGVYREPASDLSLRPFMRSLLAHALGHN
jgi:hypothetical protein